VLDNTRELDTWLMYRSPLETRVSMRRVYDEDRWLGQPYFPVTIVEKDTMEPICQPIARGWQMPFASSRGYGSLKLQHDVAEQLIHRKARTGQSARVLFISDHDPSGFDLQRAWRDALDDFGVDFTITRIALTHDQVQNPALDISDVARRGIEDRRS